MRRCMGCMTELEEKQTICPYCGYEKGATAEEAYYLPTETILGQRYIIGKVLGYGGFGVTYLSWDLVLKQKVAVKEYFPSDYATRGLGSKKVTVYSGDAFEQFKMGLESFLSEAKRLAQLHYVEGVVRIYDCIQENGTGYIVMEYLSGNTVKEILDKGKKYTYSEAEKVIINVLNALVEVHKEGIIHRDIAPDNIFITTEGEVKLLDFGAARYAASTKSKSLSIILKPGYAPEEQYRSHGKQGPWTDVYGTGATFYRMITGSVPEESIERMVEDLLERPSKLGVAIPAEKEEILLTSMNVKAEKRFQTAEEFRNALLEKKDSQERIQKNRKTSVRIRNSIILCFGIVIVGAAPVLYFINHMEPELRTEHVTENIRIESDVLHSEKTETDETTVTEDNMVEEIGTEEASFEETATEEMNTKEAIKEEAVTEERGKEEASAEETITEEVATEEAITEETAMEEAVTEETPAEGTATEEVATEEAVTEETATEEVGIEETSAEETATEEAATEEVSTEELATEESTVKEVEPVAPKRVLTRDSTLIQKVLDGTVMDSRFSFAFEANKDTKCEIWGYDGQTVYWSEEDTNEETGENFTKQHTSVMPVDDSKSGKIGCWFYDIGDYQGKQIDLKCTYFWKPLEVNGTKINPFIDAVISGETIGFSFSHQAYEVLFELYSEGKPININMNIGLNDIDSCQYFGLKAEDGTVHKIQCQDDANSYYVFADGYDWFYGDRTYHDGTLEAAVRIEMEETHSFRIVMGCEYDIWSYPLKDRFYIQEISQVEKNVMKRQQILSDAVNAKDMEKVQEGYLGWLPLKEVSFGSYQRAEAPDFPKYSALDYVSLCPYSDMAATVIVTEEPLMLRMADEAAIPQKEGTIQEGDCVNIDYVVEIDGKIMEDFSGIDYDVIDLKRDSDQLIAGLAEGLIGVEVGETVQLDLSFPKDCPRNELKGKKAKFTITVNYLQRRPEMTEDVIEHLAGDKTVKEYKEDIFDEMKKEAAINQLSQVIVQNSQIQGYPDELLQYHTELSYRGGILSYYKVSENEFRDKVEQNVKNRMAEELVLDAIAETEGFAVSEEEYLEDMSETAKTHGYDSVEEMIQLYGDPYFRKVALREKAREYIYTHADVNTMEADYSIGAVLNNISFGVPVSYNFSNEEVHLEVLLFENGEEQVLYDSKQSQEMEIKEGERYTIRLTDEVEDICMIYPDIDLAKTHYLSFNQEDGFGYLVVKSLDGQEESRKPYRSKLYPQNAIRYALVTLNVRKLPDTSKGEILTKYSQGQEIVVCGEAKGIVNGVESDWYMVITDEGYGFISAKEEYTTSDKKIAEEAVEKAEQERIVAEQPSQQESWQWTDNSSVEKTSGGGGNGNSGGVDWDDGVIWD